MRNGTGILAALTAAAAFTLAAAPIAAAKDGDVRVAGTCTRSSTAALKLSAENGRIEVELEVDQNRNGVRWTVAVRQNGRSSFSAKRLTKAPSGSFTARFVAPNAAGVDRFQVRATSASGEACTARASFA